MGRPITMKLDSPFLGILVVIVLLTLMSGLTMALTFLMYSPGANQCKSLCSSYNYSFASYNVGVLSSSECWCRNSDNKPERVS